MSEQEINHENTTPKIQFLTEYGIYEVGDTTIVSSPTWTQAMEDIKDRDFKANTVLFPELITIADSDFSQLQEQKDKVQKDLDSICAYSKTQPDSTFVVGSPHYVEGQEKPYNGAFIIKNGEIVEVGHKRLGALTEENSLLMDRTQPPIKLGDSSLVICRDIGGVVFGPDSQRQREGFFSMTIEDKDEIQKLVTTKFIDPLVDRLFVISCWGYGLHPAITGPISETQEGLNNYYKRSMEYAIKTMFQNNPQIKEILVCDRAPISQDPVEDRVASKPMSVIARR